MSNAERDDLTSFVLRTFFALNRLWHRACMWLYALNVAYQVVGIIIACVSYQDMEFRLRRLGGPNRA